MLLKDAFSKMEKENMWIVLNFKPGLSWADQRAFYPCAMYGLFPFFLDDTLYTSPAHTTNSQLQCQAETIILLTTSIYEAI